MLSQIVVRKQLMVIFFAQFLMGCDHEPQGIPATYCVAIAVPRQETLNLVASFDSFAEANGLHMSETSTPNREFSNDAKSEAIIIATHMGELGTLVSLHVVNDSSHREGIQQKLETFVDSKIKPTWPATECSQVDGLELPTLYD